MPEGAKVLTAAAQGSKVCVWAEVDTSQPCQPVEFEAYCTGAEMPENPGRYIGTALLGHGALVFHIYVKGQA